MNPNDPMAQLLNSLPPAPASPVVGGNDTIFSQQPPMFTQEPPQPSASPVPPVYQPPAPQPPQWPPAPAAPPYQQPVAPGTPVQQQSSQGPLNQYPLAPIPLAPQPQDQPPAWALGMMQDMQTLQQQIQQPQPQAGDPNTWPWPDIPQTWQGFAVAVDRMAEQKTDAKLKAWQQEQQTQAQQQEALRAQADREFDQVEAQLQQLGYLPPVANPNDPNDVGRAATRELYAYGIANGVSDAQGLARMAPTLKALHDSGIYFDHTRNTLVRRGSQSAAAQAPIAGAGPVMGAAGGGDGQAGPTNRQLATMSLSELAAAGSAVLGQ